tara:strand:+ start:677 stop:985 length:309 start_codon:yes stop_codon:yes gene_type:complete
MDKNLRRVEVRRIEADDAPEYVDAYIFYAEDETGRELAQPELDALNEDYDTIQYWVRETLNNAKCIGRALKYMFDPHEVAKHKRDAEADVRGQEYYPPGWRG